MGDDEAGGLTADQVWKEALGELQLQLTSATFNTWLSRSSLIAFENGVWTVGVHSGYAKDWLENRLLTMIKRTVAGIVGGPADVRFVARELDARPVLERRIISTENSGGAGVEAGGNGSGKGEKAGAGAGELARNSALDAAGDLAPDDCGWYPISAYASRFWRPLLGRVGWAAYEIVRESDKRPPRLRTEWTPMRAWSAPALAEDVPCGRQALTGCTRNGVPQLGAFDRMVALDVARIERHGREPHVVYEISVRVALPWLRAEQVAMLNERLQVKHARWIEKRGLT